MRDIFTNRAENSDDVRESLFSTRGTEGYAHVLATVQQSMTGSLSADVKSMSERDLRDAILKCITDNNITCSLTDSPAELTDYIYHDMAGYSFITREKLFDLPGFEELDVNAWNSVDIIVNGKREKTGYSFLSPRQAVDIHRRMLQKTNTVFYDARPYALTDLGAGIRIACMKAPLVDEAAGISSSIRKVSASVISRESLLESALTEDMLELLTLCLRFGVSMCFSGECGSGKTTLAGYLLNEAARHLRTFTIEEGSREWDFLQCGDDRRVTNSVVHMKTRPSDKPELAVTQNMGLQYALRYNPTVIGVGEMRSDEAYAAAEASNTGHTVVSTVHANSAADAPDRIVSLCKKAYDFTDDTLMSMVANAFPIQVYQEFLPDNTRRVTEIIEVTGYEGGKLRYNTLYEFHVEDNVYRGDRVEVVGGFRRVKPISEKLHQRMLKKGARRGELEKFIKAPDPDRLLTI